VRIINLVLIIILSIPFLYVLGIVASDADMLGPISVGTYIIELNQVSDLGRSLASKTEKLMHKEIDFVLLLASKTNFRGLI